MKASRFVYNSTRPKLGVSKSGTELVMEIAYDEVGTVDYLFLGDIDGKEGIESGKPFQEMSDWQNTLDHRILGLRNGLGITNSNLNRLIRVQFDLELLGQALGELSDDRDYDKSRCDAAKVRALDISCPGRSLGRFKALKMDHDTL